MIRMKTPLLIFIACFLAPIFTLGQNLTVTLNIDQAISCNGGNDGIISANVSGEAAPVLFSWSTGATTASINNLAVGTYTLMVTDTAAGLMINVSTTLNEPAAIVGSATIANAGCLGGTITVTATGGTGNATFNYTLDGGSPQTSNVFNNVPSGPHSIEITDVNACSFTLNLTVANSNGVQISSLSQTNVSCNGQSDGSVVLNVVGGQNYTFFNGTTPNPNASSFSGLAAGTYALRVADSNGCEDTVDVTITEPPVLQINSLSSLDPACSADNGSITVNASGGTPNYSYQLNGGSSSALPTFGNLGPGTYVLSVQDANGCTSSRGDTLTTPTTLTINNLTSSPVKCNGGSDGSISLDASNAPDPYIFSLTQLGNPTVIQSFTNVADGATRTFANLPAGIYEVRVLDFNGCELVNTTEILQPNLPIAIGLIQSQSQTLIPCFKATTGQLGLQGVGGNGNYTFQLYNASGLQSSLSGDTISFTGLGSDTYGVLLTDNQGCKDSSSFTITQVGRPSIDFNFQDSSLCNFQDAVTYSGNGIYANAIFTDDNNILNTNSLIPNFPNLQNDSIIDIFINGVDTSVNSCVFVDTFQVRIRPRPIASFAMPTDSLFCSSELIPLMLAGDNVLIGSADSIIFSEFVGQGVVDTTFFVPAQAGKGAQELAYIITDNYGCTDTALKKVFVLPAPNSAYVRDSVCEGQPINFVLRSSLPNSFSNDSLQAFFNDNSLFYEILTDSAKWLFQGESTASGDSVFHIFERAGQASVQLLDTTNLIGCSSRLNTVVDVGDMPEPRFEWRNACLGDNTLFIDQTDSLQGVPRDRFLSFEWTFGDGAVSSNSLQFDPKHTYTQINCCYPAKLKITTTLGCVDSAETEVYILPVVDSFPYELDFESNDGNWVSEGSPQALWSWEELSGSLFTGDSRGWQTASDPIYPANTQAFLNSACYDLSPLKRPALAMEIWSDTENADGTVLQVLYSDQDSADWFVLGDIDNQGLASGLNWYNSAAIFSRPGEQEGGLGWTESDTDFQVARHKLDAVQDSGKVRFRLAFGSDNRTPENTFLDGFALDSVWIGERDRVLSVEAFSDDQGLSQDSLIQWQANNREDAIVIRYPGSGPFFADNPAPPRARSLYYGISVPEQIVMDGSAYNDALGDFSQQLISLRSLVAANFEIDIDTNRLESPIRLKALQNFGPEQEIVVSVMVVEKEPKLSLVVRKILPNPGGISYLGWNANQNEDIIIAWQINDNPSPEIVNDYDSLSVVVMVQDQNTKEVLQSAISPIWSGLLDPALAQRQRGPEAGLTQNRLYPNPSTGIFWLEFSVPDLGPKSIKVWDLKGRSVYQEIIYGESQKKSIDLGSLPAGVYHLKVEQGNGASLLDERIVKLPSN
ncbi:MAG: T9SS type A sorting domain-containing protein [Bacteroidota bacterium]